MKTPCSLEPCSLLESSHPFNNVQACLWTCTKGGIKVKALLLVYLLSTAMFTYTMHCKVSEPL